MPIRAPGSVAFMLRALRYRNYRLFFGGQIVSLAGTWITTTATSWLVYRLTGSALLLGLVGFAGQFPAFLLGPFAGILVDRWDRRRLLVVTQVISMLAVVRARRADAQRTHHRRVRSSSSTSSRAIVNAFDMPGRQAFLIAMIENRDDLPQRDRAQLVDGQRRAAARAVDCRRRDRRDQRRLVLPDRRRELPRRHRGAARDAGRAAAGARPAPRPGARQQFVEGWRYAFGFRPIRSIILLLALVSLVGVPYSVLMPVFAATVFHGGPHTLGFLMTRVRLRRARRRAVAGDAPVGRSASAASSSSPARRSAPG